MGYSQSRMNKLGNEYGIKVEPDDSNSYERDLKSELGKLWKDVKSEDHALIKLHVFRILFSFCMYLLITGPTETSFKSNVIGFLMAIGVTIMITRLINAMCFIWCKRTQIVIGILSIFLAISLLSQMFIV